MATLTRADLARPELEREIATVPELGGDVIVQGLLLRDRLAVMSRENPGQFGHVATMLAAAVVQADGAPLMTADEWERFGVKHFDRAMSLFMIAKRLCGLEEGVAEKK